MKALGAASSLIPGRFAGSTSRWWHWSRYDRSAAQRSVGAAEVVRLPKVWPCAMCPLCGQTESQRNSVHPGARLAFFTVPTYLLVAMGNDSNLEPHLFSPFTLRSITLRNRIGVSPMCQYSATDGLANDWHYVHLGSRAVGGAGLVIVEATAVAPEGRITPGCLGLWSDRHAEPLARIAAFLKKHGAVPAIQIAHAGRKASADLPWNGGAHLGEAQGGWPTIAPSAIPFGDVLPKIPRAMIEDDIIRVRKDFVAAAARALAAGFEWLELHAAHGYLFSEFLSPLANHRTDRYGGIFDNRIRFLVETARAVREVWPEKLPLAVRISASDWKDGGWDIEQSVALAKRLKPEGVDLIDCSSGGVVPDAKIKIEPGYQVPFADKIRHGADIATAAVGFITEPKQADDIVRGGKADVVLLARQMLVDPYWPGHAAKALGYKLPPPNQYARAW
jgi:2,4-dienoyl-CoA reductase-like NADH-dependent reductase (Old Yellow Enzyme family)